MDADVSLVGSEVEPADSQDRGLFNPVWVRVENEDIDETNFMDHTVKVFGVDRDLIQHDDGEFYADLPFMQVASATGYDDRAVPLSRAKRICAARVRSGDGRLGTIERKE